MIAGRMPLVRVIVAGTVPIAKLIVSGFGFDTSALTFKIACRSEPNPLSFVFVTRNGFVTVTADASSEVLPVDEVAVAVMT